MQRLPPLATYLAAIVCGATVAASSQSRAVVATSRLRTPTDTSSPLVLDVSTREKLAEAKLPPGNIVLTVTNLVDGVAKVLEPLASARLVIARAPAKWPGMLFKILVIKELSSRAEPDQLILVVDGTDVWFRMQAVDPFAKFNTAYQGHGVLFSSERGFEMLLGSDDAAFHGSSHATLPRAFDTSPSSFPPNPIQSKLGVPDKCNETTKICLHNKIPNPGLLMARAADLKRAYSEIWSHCPTCKNFDWSESDQALQASEMNQVAHHLVESGLCGGDCHIDYASDIFHTICGCSECTDYKWQGSELFLAVSGKEELPIDAAVFHAPGKRNDFRNKKIMRAIALKDRSPAALHIFNKGVYMQNQKRSGRIPLTCDSLPVNAQEHLPAGVAREKHAMADLQVLVGAQDHPSAVAAVGARPLRGLWGLDWGDLHILLLPGLIAFATLLLLGLALSLWMKADPTYQNVASTFGIVLICGACNGVMQMNFTVLIPHSEEVMQALGASDPTVASGAVIGVMYLPALLSLSICQRFVGWGRSREVLIAGCTVLLLGNWLFFWVGSSQSLPTSARMILMLFARICQGMAAGIGYVARETIVVTTTLEERRSSFSWFFRTGDLGLAMGPLAAVGSVKLAEAQGWQYCPVSMVPTLLMVFVAAVLLASIMFCFPTRSELEQHKQSAGQVVQPCEGADPGATRSARKVAVAALLFIGFSRVYSQSAWESVGFLFLKTGGWSSTIGAVVTSCCVFSTIPAQIIFMRYFPNTGSGQVLQRCFLVMASAVLAWRYLYLFSSATVQLFLFMFSSMAFMASLSISATVTDALCSIAAFPNDDPEDGDRWGVHAVVYYQLLAQSIIGRFAGAFVGRSLFASLGWTGFLSASFCLLLVVEGVILVAVPYGITKQ